MELDLKDYMQILRRRWVLIASIVLVITMIAALVSIFLLKPTYEASTKIIVNGSNERAGYQQLDLNSINLDLRLIETYKEIIRTGAIMERVVEEHPEFRLTANQLVKLINIRTVNNSQVMTLSIRHADYKTAADIVNAVSETFQREIPAIMTVDNVSILDRAQYHDNPKPVSPNIPLNIAIAVVVSLLLAVGLVFLLEYLDDTIKTEQDVKQVLDLPVLAEITRISEGEMSRSNRAASSQVSAKGAGHHVNISEKAINNRY